MITNDSFIQSTKQFNELEKRGSLYNMAIRLIKNNFEVEAYLLILATWNFARFRYAVNDFDILGFQDTLDDLEPHFEEVKNEDIRTIDLDRYKAEIKEIFNKLSSIKGIEYTGASKIMHLKNRNVFVMWDGYIKGEKLRKYYNELEIVKNGVWEYKQYMNDSENYLQFLKDMQEKFKDISFQSTEKTLTKAIDEYNFVNITIPIQKMEKESRDRPKKR